MLAGLIALAASVGVLSPVGMAHAAEVNDTAYSAPGPWKLEATVSTSRVALTDGKAGAVKGELEGPQTQVEGRRQDVLAVRAYGPDTAATVAYRVSMLGWKTGYWVRLEVRGEDTADTPCAFYYGDPFEGGNRLDVAPFNCRYTIHRYFPYGVEYRFDIDLNRWAEASGKITTQDLSLTKGTFRSDLPYSVPGVTEMAPFQYTSFEAVNREGDKSYFRDQARTEFSYQIAVNGKPTGFWVAGMSTNYRDTIMFKGDGRCAIYDHDPLLNKGRLDDATPIVSKDYACKAEGRYIPGAFADGNIHYHTDFTVARTWP